MGIIKRLSLIFSRNSLLTKYTFFVRPNLDYADKIYDKPLNKSFKRKLEIVQYKEALMITGAIKGASQKRLFQELGLESLANKRCSHTLFSFHKIIQGLLPSYLQIYHNAVSEEVYLTQLITQEKIKPIPARTKLF